MSTDNTSTTRYKHDWVPKKEDMPSRFVGSILGTLNMRKLASKFPIVNIENEDARKEILKWMDEVNFFTLLKKTFYQTSYRGGVYWVLTKHKEEWIPVIPDQIVFVEKDAIERLEKLIVHTRTIKGNKHNFFIYEEHVKGKIIRKLKKQNNKEKEVMNFSEAWENASDSNVAELKLETSHELREEIPTVPDMITAFYISNSYAELQTENVLYGKPDRYNARPEIKLLDDSYMALKQVLRIIKPKLILRKSSGSAVTIYGDDTSNASTKDNEESKYLDGYILEIEEGQEWEDSDGNVTAFIPNPQVIEYAQKQYKASYLQLLDKAGFAGADDADSAQKTTTELSQIRDSEFGAMEDKISIFQTEAKRFLKVAGLLLDKEIGDNDGIDIQKLDVRTEITLLDNLIKAVDAGFEEQITAIARYKGISQTEAKTVLENIKASKEEAMNSLVEKNGDEIDPIQDEVVNESEVE